MTVEERVDRLERNLESLVTVVAVIGNSQAQLVDAQTRLTGLLQRLAELQKHTDTRLSALIKMMNEWVLSQGRIQ